MRATAFATYYISCLNNSFSACRSCIVDEFESQGRISTVADLSLELLAVDKSLLILLYLESKGPLLSPFSFQPVDQSGLGRRKLEQQRKGELPILPGTGERSEQEESAVAEKPD